MGLKLFGSSSSADKSHSLIHFSSSVSGNKLTALKSKNTPDPKPDNYKILSSIVMGKYIIIEIQYLDCTNYEGKKVLVFECRLNDLLNQKLIDPHFSENKNFISPIARFEPTKRGIDWAIDFITTLIENGNK